MRLKINYRKRKKQNKTAKNPKFLEPKQYATKQPWITEKIKEAITKFLETNNNKDTMIQNLCDTAKAVLRGKFIYNLI